MKRVVCFAVVCAILGIGVIGWKSSARQEYLRVCGGCRHHDDAVLVLAFSPDGRFIAAGHSFMTDHCVQMIGSPSCAAALADATTGRRHALFNLGPELVLVKFSSDSESLLTSNMKGWGMSSAQASAALWGTINPGLEKVLVASSGCDLALCASPDFRLIAWRCDNGVLVCDAKSNAELQVIEIGDEFSAHDMAFMADGNMLAIVAHKFDSNGRLILWDCVAGSFVSTTELDGEWSSVAFSADGKLLATMNQGTLSVWEVVTGHRMASVRAHTEPTLSSPVFSNDGTTLVSIGSIGRSSPLVRLPLIGPVLPRGPNAEIKFWDVPTASLRSTRFADVPSTITAAAISSDSNTLAIGDMSGRTTLLKTDIAE